MAVSDGSSFVRRTPAGLLDLATDGLASLVAPSSPPVVVLDLDGTTWTGTLVDDLVAVLDGPGPLVVGHATTAVPEEALPVLERLTVTLAPSGPGRAWVPGGSSALGEVCAAVAASPDAALSLHALLRVTPRLPVPEAVTAEAAAYSMLLAGPEFARWRAAAPRRTPPAVVDPVRLERVDDVLRITLDNPARRNAFSAPVRDALVDALRLGALDDSLLRVELRGNGPVFCSGGDLDEFGTASSPTAAYRTRLARNPGLLLHAIGDRAHVHVHGAAVGAGIELAAFAGRVTATEDAWMQLPELRLGLVPGAGGTVSIARRIGPWRTAWMVLTGARVDARTARAWGLVDELV